MKKKIEGIIVSNKMQKTVVVKAEFLKKHPKYQKFYHFSKKYKAHSNDGELGIGDRVVIEETRPLSKEKNWVVKEVIEKAVIEKDEEVAE